MSEQQYRPKASLSSRIRSFEHGGVHAESALSPTFQKPDPPKSKDSSGIEFFEQGAIRKEDEPEPSEKQDLPKGAVSARINALDANSARELKESLGQNGERKPATTDSRHSIFEKIKALEMTSTRQLEESRPTIEMISGHFSVQEQVDQLSNSSSAAGGEILVKDHGEGAAGDDIQEIITPSQKLTHPTKNRARPLTKNRLPPV